MDRPLDKAILERIIDKVSYEYQHPIPGGKGPRPTLEDVKDELIKKILEDFTYKEETNVETRNSKD